MVTRLIRLLALISMLAACGEGVQPELMEFPEQAEPDDEMCGPDSPWYECQEVQQEVMAGGTLGWRIPASVRAAGDRQRVSYDGAPAWNGGANCTGGLTEGARVLGRYLLEHFKTYQVQGYNCRVIGGTNSMSLHGTGRALDIMITTLPGGRANNDKGDPIGNWLIENAQDIGVQYIIWDRTQWKPYASGRKDSYYGGVSPHYNHLHIEITKEAARLNTPWFKQRQFADPPDGAELTANFEARPMAKHPNHANFRLDNTSSEPFENVVFGYEVPDFFKIDSYTVWKRGPADSGWVQQELGGHIANVGKVPVNRLAPGASKRLVLHLSRRDARTEGSVKGWVRHIDRLYKGVAAFDTPPTVNAFDSRLRARADVEVP